MPQQNQKISKYIYIYIALESDLNFQEKISKRLQEKENQTELLESEAIDGVTTISGSKLRQQCNSNFSVKTSNIMG